MSVLIDTNFLLSAITDRDATQRETTQKLFTSEALHRASIQIPQFILFEATFVLTSNYRQSEERVALMLGDLVAMAGVEIVHELPVDLWLQLWPTKVPGQVDSALAALSLANNWPVATFDQDFARRLIRIGGKVWQPE